MIYRMCQMIYRMHQMIYQMQFIKCIKWFIECIKYCYLILKQMACHIPRLANTKLRTKTALPGWVNNFSVDYPVYYLRFLSTYPWYYCSEKCIPPVFR